MLCALVLMTSSIVLTQNAITVVFSRENGGSVGPISPSGSDVIAGGRDYCTSEHWQKLYVDLFSRWVLGAEIPFYLRQQGNTQSGPRSGLPLLLPIANQLPVPASCVNYTRYHMRVHSLVNSLIICLVVLLPLLYLISKTSRD